MTAFLMSTFLVALAEIGDKTQLLALLLAARYRRPWPIVWGILLATVLNHALAGVLGSWMASLFAPNTLRWLLGLSFLLMALWVLVPDKLDNEEPTHTAWGVFATTTLAFFIAEMGDKTQLATVALAAQFQSLVAVVLGTTLGMMLANAPVVFFGDRISKNISIVAVHRIAAGIFVLIGLWVLFGVRL